MVLESVGYRVLTASDGEEALEQFKASVVDAVVLDYMMPGMTGDLVALEMKRIRAHVPIVLLSAYVSAPDSVECDAFISKGQGPAMLLSVLENFLAAASI